MCDYMLELLTTYKYMLHCVKTYYIYELKSEYDKYI